MAQEAKKSSGALAGIICVVVIVGLAVGAKAGLSDKIGDDCEGSSMGCEWGAICVDTDAGKRCMKSCETDEDCHDGMSCRSLLVIGSDKDQSACR